MECPMRAFNDPDAQEALVLYGRSERWGLPRPGGWRDQDPRDLEILDAIGAVMNTPMPAMKKG